MSNSGPKFERVSSDSDELVDSSGLDTIIDTEREYFKTNITSQLHHMNKRLRISYLLLGGIAFVVLIVMASFAFWRVQLPYTSNLIDPKSLRKDYTCGASIEEAKAYGCVFDTLSMAWLPLQCQDPGLTEDFRHAREWRYWADQEGTIALREEELHLRSGPDQVIWASLEWHLVHCNYQWQKMNRAMLVGRRIEPALSDIAHTKHCGMITLDRHPLQDLLTQITVAFLTC